MSPLAHTLTPVVLLNLFLHFFVCKNVNQRERAGCHWVFALMWGKETLMCLGHIVPNSGVFDQGQQHDESFRGYMILADFFPV